MEIKRKYYVRDWLLITGMGEGGGGYNTGRDGRKKFSHAEGGAQKF